MKNWLSVLGIGLVAVVLVFTKTSWGRDQIREFFGGGESESDEPETPWKPPIPSVPQIPPPPPFPGTAQAPRQGPITSADRSTPLPGGNGRPLAPLPGPSSPLFPASRLRLTQTTLAPSAGQFRLMKPDTRGLVSKTRAELYASGVLQGIIADLNRQFVLPRDIPVFLERCGEVNAYYSPAHQQITICDEWVDKMGEFFKSQTDQTRLDSMVSATAFVFAHETGHALVHQLKLKITGQPEQVADQYAVYVLSGSNVGVKQILAAAYAFGKFAQENKPITWDSHPLDAQRKYYIYCYVYGSDPSRYQSLVNDRILPQGRADECRKEWIDMVEGLNERLVPHMR